MMRYADDAVIGREKKEDAGRIRKALALRFAKLRALPLFPLFFLV
jgi:hypothetical protein